ncbi:MAG: RagB/SusD family nutrient uptake outer membrane protein [Paludibacteraceae bacterium]
MKNKIYIYLITLFFLSSCIGMEREAVDSYKSNTFFVSRDAAISNLSAVYQSSSMSGFFEDGNTIFIDGATDNAYNQFTNQGVSYIALGTANASVKYKFVDLFRTYFTYKGIREANYFLLNVDAVDMNKDEKEVMKAEVRFLRAFNYSRKMMFFGGVPIIGDKVLARGEELNYPRKTESEVASYVISELDSIISILPLTQEKGRVTKGAALALKARVELFIKDYENAEKDAKAIMDLGIYDLFQNTQEIPNAYEALFWEKHQTNKNRDKEVILEVCYTPPIYHSTIVAFYTSPEGGWNSLSPTQSLVDAYETQNGLPIYEDPAYNPDNPFKNRDSRFYSTIIYPGAMWNGRIFNSLGQNTNKPDEYFNSSSPNISRTGYSMRKYCPPLSEEPSGDPSSEIDGVSFIVFRYAEVLLTYAESLIEQNKNLPLAIDAINKVRRRANMPDITDIDQMSLRKRVRNERRVELAFEGLRWYDIKRWNTAGSVMNGPVYGVRTGQVNINTGQIIWTSSDHIRVGDTRVFDIYKDYYWPIPQEDIDNSNGVLKQNPGWE